jgi:putative serine protease PepD
MLLAVTAACSDSPSVEPTATARPQAEIVAEAKDSVVRVETTTRNGDFTGSGFVISGSSTVVATAYHVVENANAIWIRRGDEADSAKIAAELIAFDDLTDIALLRVIDLEGGLDLSDSPPDAGKAVLAMGFPLGIFGSVSVSQGIISRRVEFEGDFFVQHDAEIMQGNSGGPLIDDSGRVIGINVLVVPDDVITSAGLNFAVHVGELTQLMQSVGIESSSIVALPTSTPVPTPTLSPAQVDAAATAVLRVREIDSAKATSTVIARNLEATIEIESTVLAEALATREVETSATAQAQALASIARTEAVKVEATAILQTQNVEATATAGAERVARLATAESVAEYCQVHSGEIMLGPISDSMTNKDGLTGYYDPRGAVNSTDFVATITFTNPSDGDWNYGLIFRKDNEIGVNTGYGEALVFHTDHFHLYSIRQGAWEDSEGDLRLISFHTKVRQQNELEIYVNGDVLTLAMNGIEYLDNSGRSELALVIPSPDQLIITPFVGWGDDDNVGTVDFENFSVKCQ